MYERDVIRRERERESDRERERERERETETRQELMIESIKNKGLIESCGYRNNIIWQPSRG